MANNNMSIPPVVANTPANVDKHQADLASRQAERDKKQPKSIRCLDPIVAAQYENRKPLYEWKIECEIFQQASGKRRARFEKHSEQVVAQNEDDAWAIFCVKIERYPGRKHCNPTITKLQKRTLSED